MVGRVIAAVVIVAVIAGGAYYFLAGRYDSIQDILDNPEKYTSRDVVIKGKVLDALMIPPIPGIEYTGAYSLGDKKSKIWVGTKGQVPQKGQIKVVRGTVKPSLSIMGRNLGTVVFEKEPE
ncbi:MAG: hypothetical protein ACUVTZ_06165 [Armatimonadota bacterium]